MIYRETIVVAMDAANFINKVLDVEPDCESDCFGEDEKISYTATFSNGFQADVECIGVQYEEGGCNTAWTQAVLFNPDGCEVNCSAPDSSFFDEWWLTDSDGNDYYINVITENDNDGDTDDGDDTDFIMKNRNRAERRRARRNSIARRSRKTVEKCRAGNPEILEDLGERKVGQMAKGSWLHSSVAYDWDFIGVGRLLRYKPSTMRKLEKARYSMSDYSAYNEDDKEAV